MFLYNKKSNYRKRVAFILTIIMVAETIMPTASWALTGGPSSPEFSSFEPVATTNMVNEFSGDFTYNIPVLNIPGANNGGYALSLSYHSGETLESEASWVGYGWTLNPGSISRSKRGFADDSKADHIYYNEVPKNWTASVGASAGDFEIFSTDIPVTVNASIRYNNYKGFGYTAGAGVNVKGIASLGYSVSDGTGSFSAKINPAGLLSLAKKKKGEKENETKNSDGTKAKESSLRDRLENAQKNRDDPFRNKNNSNKPTVTGVLNGMASAYGMHAFNEIQAPTSVTPYDGLSFNVSVGLETDPGPVPFGITLGMSGNYTQQENIKSRNVKGYGYLYSASAYSDNAAMMDYYTEKDSPYNKRDRYLGIPFSNADQFSISGEGLSGGFRLQNKQTGRFRPNEVGSKTTIIQVGAEFHVGLDYGSGVDVGVGLQTLNIYGDTWGGSSANYGALSSNYQFTTSGDEPYFMRFDNDMGGSLEYGDDNLTTANVNVTSSLPGAKSCKAELSTATQKNNMTSTIDGTINRSGRSSYIGYHLNSEMATTSPSGKLVYAYEKFSRVNTQADRSNHPDQIGEISTINEEGNTYVYGLPVYSKNEKNLQYDMQGLSAGSIASQFISYKDVSSYKMKVGQESPEAYPTSFLLTQITTPDYVDRTLNGPTTDDFGGYTRFAYTKKYSSYHWRMPYSGYYYAQNNISDPLDDVGSFSSGDKEVYYLDTIVTKTHIAVFKRTDREDGLDAGSDVTAGTSSAVKGNNPLQKLDAIDLYTNNNGTLGKLIKKVRFDYDYSLCSGVTNRATTGGKLTLKRVWFEYEGIVNAKISPYVFTYTYPDIASTYPSPYNSNFSEYNNLITNPTYQNPTYSLTAVDAWGNYQYDGANRYSNGKKHLNQTPDANFDPAAWQLKRIQLPSGGEIHVHYEQDDYQYVQNRRACAFVSLKNSTNGEADVFELNTENDLGYSISDKQALVNIINQELAGEKIYFKFLYSLIGNASPGLNQCNSDYISGYVNFNSAGLNGANTVTISVGSGGSSHDLPHLICKDMVKKEKGGKLNTAGNCDPNQGIQDGNDPTGVVMQLVNKIGTSFIPGNVCKKIEPTLSYFRIPLLKAKLGGGLRVKRILMYDANGIETGSPVLYGTEYIYKTESGESSGVASNEPSSIREENPLVTFLAKRNEQTFFQKAGAGIDREQYEGPLGESILPSASVGYSRVVAKNIFSGKTNTGFVVSEFYTTKDYPFDMIYQTTNMPGVSCTDINDQTFEKDWLNIPAVWVNYSVSNIWTAQGYRFVKNNMNGQPKSVSTYAGTYSAGSLGLINKSSATEYEYFQPGEKVNVLQGNGSIVSTLPGKEMEVVYESRSVEDITKDMNTEFDIDFGIWGYVPIPYFSGSGSVSYSESKMRTHVTTKIINYPVIQKTITSIQEGITHKTENLVFSAYTGKPVHTRTSDGFNNLVLEQTTPNKQNGYYTTYNIPAYTQYQEVGQKAINERKKIFSSSGVSMTLQQISGTSYSLSITSGTSSILCDAIGGLTRGDLIAVNTTSNISPSNYYFHIDNVNGGVINLLSSGNYNNAGTIPSSIPSASIISVEVLKSGRTNQLNVNAGSYTVYGMAGLSTYTSSIPVKQAFVDALNNAVYLTSNNLGNMSGTSHTIAVNSNDINFALAGGGCKVSSNKDYQVKVTYSAGNISLLTIIDGVTTTLCDPKPFPIFYVLDNITGQVKYYDPASPCLLYPVCFKFCDAPSDALIIPNVVASSANTMDHVWPYDASKFDLYGINGSKNDYETGAKGKWRTKSSFVYKESIVGGAKSSERIYKAAGTYSMTQYNWKNESYVDTLKWIRTSTVTKYSPNGEAIEEKDAIGIYSAAKYGYDLMMPYLVSKNSTYGSVQFESFEKSYTSSGTTYLEDGLVVNSAQIDNSTAHSGASSIKLYSSTNTFSINTTTLTTQMLTSGASLKMWVKDPQYAAMPIKCTLSNVGATINIPLQFAKIARTGEWSLYEAKITSWSSLTVGTAFNVILANNISASPAIWIDDIRFQPLDAQVNAYVYDKNTLRLLASFDDQNFGLFYQYNKEGKLIRKMIETERGLKTITETQYHSKQTSR